MPYTGTKKQLEAAKRNLEKARRAARHLPKTKKQLESARKAVRIMNNLPRTKKQLEALKEGAKLGPEASQKSRRKKSKRCDICKKLCSPFRDHSHKTKKKRGTLCICCNTGLGMFRDSRRILKRAIAYLDLWKNLDA